MVSLSILNQLMFIYSSNHPFDFSVHAVFSGTILVQCQTPYKLGYVSDFWAQCRDRFEFYADSVFFGNTPSENRLPCVPLYPVGTWHLDIQYYYRRRLRVGLYVVLFVFSFLVFGMALRNLARFFH